MTSFSNRSRISLVFLLLWGVPHSSLAAGITVRAGVTDMSVRIQQIHQMGLWVCMGVGIIVIGAMFYTMFAHRRLRDRESTSFGDSMLAEFIWTLIPILILVATAIPATSTLRHIEINPASETINFGNTEQEILHQSSDPDKRLSCDRTDVLSG